MAAIEMGVCRRHPRDQSQRKLGDPALAPSRTRPTEKLGGRLLTRLAVMLMIWWGTGVLFAYFFWVPVHSTANTARAPIADIVDIVRSHTTG